MFVDKMMASYLAPGSIAAFGYAEKIIQVPIMIFTASLATAVFPFFAAQVAESRIDELKDSLAKSIQMSGLIFLPITAGLVALAAPIVQLILQRGAFDRTAAEVTSLIVVCFSFQLFFYSTVIILVRAFLAFQEIATLVKVVMGGMVLNIVLNLAFIKLVKPPVAGIALSTSCVYLIMACVFFVILRMRIGALHGKEMLISVAKIAVLSAVMGGVMYSMRGVCQRLFPHPMVMGQALALCAAGASGCLIFLACGYFINVRELRSLARFVTPWMRSS